ncbi:tetratricopeptide repeat protein [Streptomyces sp. WG-D5]
MERELAGRAAETLVSLMRSGLWQPKDWKRFSRYLTATGVDEAEAHDMLRELHEQVQMPNASTERAVGVWRGAFLDRLDVAPRTAGQLRAVLAHYDEFAPPHAATDEPGTATATANTVTGGTHHSVVQATRIDTLHQHFAPAPDAVDGRPIHDIGPAEFGVRPTRRAPGLPDVPPYVPRDCDAELAAKLAGPGLVLLLGKSVTGMSYTAWHATRGLDGHQVYAPERGADLRALLGTLRTDPAPALLWLDDIEGHLGERGLDPGLLARLTALGVHVLATMDVDTYYERRTGSAPGDRVVAHAHTVELPVAWSAAEFGRLAEQADDPRAYEAYLWTDGANPAAYLALGHLLHEEWQRLSARYADPDGVAIVRAALDVARAGWAGAVPLPLLQNLGAPGATHWAAEDRIGNVGFLMPGEKPKTWRAHGALVAGVLRSSEAQLTEDRLWEVHAAIGDFFVHETPEERAVADVLAAVLRPRAEGGNITAAARLGSILHFEDGGEFWLRQSAEAGHPQAANDLADVLLHSDRAQEAVPYLERSAAEGNAWAGDQLARHYRTRAEDLLTEAARTSPAAACDLGDLIAGTPGREPEAMRHYLTAWHGGSADAALRIGCLLHARGDAAEAESWYRHAARTGSARAQHHLGVLLYDKGGHDAEAEALLTRAAEAGRTAAHTALGMLKERQGDHRGAYAHYRKGDEALDPEAAHRLALTAPGPETRARRLRRAAERGHYRAQKETGKLTPPAPDTVKE